MAAISGSRITVSAASATILVDEAGWDQEVYVQNMDATNAIDLGDSSVASGAGYQVAKATALSHPVCVPAGQKLYAIATTAACSVAVLVIPNS